jgi:hypothetical protein
MAESEFLRQKREREFQARMLAATEKPRASRILRIVNAPFFLWFLSATFITVGGAYFTTRQQCVAEAEKIADQYEKLGVEIERRETYIFHTLETHNTAASMRAALSQIREHYSDFHSRPLFELIEQRDKLLERIDTSPFEQTKRENDAFLANFREKLSNAGGRVDIFEPIFRGESPTELQDVDIEALRLYAKAAELHLRGSFSNMFKIAEPACSFLTVTDIAITGQRKKFLTLSFDIIDTFYPDGGFSYGTASPSPEKTP